MLGLDYNEIMRIPQRYFAVHLLLLQIKLVSICFFYNFSPILYLVISIVRVQSRFLYTAYICEWGEKGGIKLCTL